MRRTAVAALLAGLVLGHLVVTQAAVVCTALGTLTTHLQLCKPATGEVNWDAAINNNFDVIDSVLGGIAGAAPANGQLLIGNGTSFTVANLTAATGVTVTNGAGSISLAVGPRIAVTANPTAITSGLPASVATSVEQTFAAVGVRTSDLIFVNGPAQTAQCPMIAWRPSAADTIALRFLVATTVTCTPATGTYNVQVIR